MDSKFGPDGALYVQVYEGFFTTGSDAGLYRFKYTGGADTPGPDPQWQKTAAARQIQFSVGASGGVSYEWDFGDGQTSAGTNPIHTYADAGNYTAKLTVTYADGEKSTKTTAVPVVGRHRRADDDRPAQRRDAGRHLHGRGQGLAARATTAPAVPASSGPSTGSTAAPTRVARTPAARPRS